MKNELVLSRKHILFVIGFALILIYVINTYTVYAMWDEDYYKECPWAVGTQFEDYVTEYKNYYYIDFSNEYDAGGNHYAYRYIGYVPIDYSSSDYLVLGFKSGSKVYLAIFEKSKLLTWNYLQNESTVQQIYYQCNITGTKVETESKCEVTSTYIYMSGRTSSALTINETNIPIFGSLEDCKNYAQFGTVNNLVYAPTDGKIIQLPTTDVKVYLQDNKVKYTFQNNWKDDYSQIEDIELTQVINVYAYPSCEEWFIEAPPDISAMSKIYSIERPAYQYSELELDLNNYSIITESPYNCWTLLLDTQVRVEQFGSLSTSNTTKLLSSNVKYLWLCNSALGPIAFWNEQTVNGNIVNKSDDFTYVTTYDEFISNSGKDIINGSGNFIPSDVNVSGVGTSDIVNGGVGGIKEASNILDLIKAGWLCLPENIVSYLLWALGAMLLISIFLMFVKR